ncbi:hypothetical protein HZA96_02570 [Candidatus Woesearchaeota archaeon]|nr:hypothetical protein [Candidatus Woesearchaeota archaeon]
MKKIISLVAALLLLPIVLGFQCSLTSDPAYCNKIENSALNETEKDVLYSSLLYEKNSYPDHAFIEDYNLGKIITSAPENTQFYYSKYIKNAWLSFLAVFPSVIEKEILFIPKNVKIWSEYNYDIQIPQNYYSSNKQQNAECKTIYSLIDNTANVEYFHNSVNKGKDKLAAISINIDGKLTSQLTITAQVKADHYQWDKYCCAKKKGKCVQYCYTCNYKYTSYDSDSLTISESKDVQLYSKKSSAKITVTNNYLNTTKGTFLANDYSFFKISFPNSSIIKQQYYYDLQFDKKPYYIAYLEAHNTSITTQSNLFLTDNTFFVKNIDSCNLFAYNHFYQLNTTCDLTLKQENIEQLTTIEKKVDLSLLLHILIFLLFIYIIYKILKSQWKKLTFVFIFLLLIAAPFVAAEPQQEECGLTNLASCIPEKMYNYILMIINAPLLPMLISVQKLLTADVSIAIFQHVWSVIRYILSFFYVFFFLYAGFIFLTSNANPIKRSYAKDMLTNTFIMIVLIQGSYYIYDLILSLSSVMNSTILSMIDPKFFLLTADNLVNIGLEFIMSFVYALTLFFTMLMLVLRYLVVSFGVVLFPLGIFFYFIPPLKGYGKFILNLLGIFIFITFIDLLIILACSKLIEVPLFENIKILVMITCFAIVNYTLWLAIKFAMKKSSNVSIKDDIQQAAKYIALLAG